MNKLYKLFLLLSIITLFASSCGKGDAVGPQGAVGPIGPSGANGSTIYSGITAPGDATGAVGDFYLNRNDGLLYGPKTAAGWGTGFSLIGPAGVTGVNGNTVLSGTGVPAADLGNTGDYYLDKGTYFLYGPKINIGWGPGTPLQGQSGTANVMYSGWLYASNFRDTTADNSALHAADIVAPKLTTDILNSGQVQVYFTFGGGVYTLPYTSYAGGKLSTLSYWPRLGHFIITRFTADNSNGVALSTLLQYRYIIIPGGVNVTAIKNNHLNLNDYDAVKKYFRIQD
jgi:hypothetical protein